MYSNRRLSVLRYGQASHRIEHGSIGLEAVHDIYNCRHQAATIPLYLYALGLESST